MSERPAPLIVPEARVNEFVSLQDAMQAVRDVFTDMAAGTAINYPVVRETLAGSAAVFGVKSAQYRRHQVVGLKAGGYFPENAALGDTNHQSFVILFDERTGKPTGMVGGNLVTRLRTAAAAAISIDALARRDAGTLVVIGAGAQVEMHIRAALLVRPFREVLLWNRGAGRAALLAARWTGSTPIQLVASAEEAVRRADVIITLTNATQPIVQAGWVRPGCHLACMGADTAGKQEVEVELVRTARVFTDQVAQAISIGECQSAFRAGIIDTARIATIGDVLRGASPGRTTNSQITLFDGTGVAAQDIAMAALALSRARASAS